MDSYTGSNGRMNAADFLERQDFKFNASCICKDERDAGSLLYSGSLINPTEDRKFDWAQNQISTPGILGFFNAHRAQVVMTGSFIVANEKHGSMVGRAEMAFRGEIDEERSDQLLMGGRVPEWNATLGFVRDSVGGAKQFYFTLAFDILDGAEYIN
ncbi:hypothetical protein I7I51_06329 [Histoplasma capsulatum]|uniref:Uncharacterized protein n=1 Tax=Ajellomyces capsulatus TaxID=5037 RepID=A0A8A1MHY4_AJECA|nr:hypothetical protein I7I51_06329 [Histoplasma capsulatum]